MKRKNKVDGQELMSDFNFISKYAKHIKSEMRRENWDEAISRMEGMHLRRYEKFGEEVAKDIKKAFNFVRSKRVLASQRAMQFGGGCYSQKRNANV